MHMGRKNGKHLESRRQKLLGIVERNEQVWELYKKYAKMQRESESRITYQLPLLWGVGGKGEDGEGMEGMEEDVEADGEEDDMDVEGQDATREIGHNAMSTRYSQEERGIEAATEEGKARATIERQDGGTSALTVDGTRDEEERATVKGGEQPWAADVEKAGINQQRPGGDVEMPEEPTESEDIEMLHIDSRRQRRSNLVTPVRRWPTIGDLDARPFEDSPSLLKLLGNAPPAQDQSTKTVRFADDVVGPSSPASGETFATEEPEVLVPRSTEFSELTSPKVVEPTSPEIVAPTSPEIIAPESPIRRMNPPPPGHVQMSPVTNPEAFPIKRIQNVQSQHYPSAEVFDMHTHRDHTGAIIEVTAIMHQGSVNHFIIKDSRIIKALGFHEDNYETISIQEEHLRIHETFSIHPLPNQRPRNPKAITIGELRSARHAYLYWLDSHGCADPRHRPVAEEARRLALQLMRRAPHVWPEIDEYWELENGPAGKTYRANRLNYLGEDPAYSDEDEREAEARLGAMSMWG